MFSHSLYCIKVKWEFSFPSEYQTPDGLKYATNRKVTFLIFVCVLFNQTWSLTGWRKEAGIFYVHLYAALHCLWRWKLKCSVQPTSGPWQQCYGSVAVCCSSIRVCLWTLKSTQREKKTRLFWMKRKNLGAQPCKLICSCCMMGTQLASLTCTQQIIIVFFSLCLSSASQCLANGLAGLIMSERNYTGPRET